VWGIPELPEKAQVLDVVTWYSDWVAPDAPLEDAATLMRDRKIGGLPVLEDGRLVGIITESDIFDAFIALRGARTQSHRITVDVEDWPAALWDIAMATRLYGIRVYSVSSYPGAPGSASCAG
jgi:acetoin utilization protein AcuB